MKAIDDYKSMVFDVSRVLSIFETCTKCYTDYLKQPTQQKENAYKSMVEQWRVEDVDLIKNKIIGYDPSHKIEKELTGDEPDKDKLKLRLEWAYMRLGMPDEDDSYFPKWHKENFAIPNKEGYGNKAMYDALTEAKGERYAFDVMCRLETIVVWVNIKIGDVEALLDGLCQWAGYYPQKPQKEPQESENSSNLAVTPPEPQQVAQGQEIKAKPTRGRGRPTNPFSSKMIDDAKGEKLKKMHSKLDGKTGKDFALLMWACINKGWCNKPTYTQVKEEFGDIGEKTGYNKYLNNSRLFSEAEKSGALLGIE